MTATAPQPPRSRTQRLSAAFVRTAEPGFYCDGHGLNLGSPHETERIVR